MRHDSAPLNRFDLITTPGVEQLGFTDRAERAVGDAFAGQARILELQSGGRTDVQAVPSLLLIRQQDAAVPQDGSGVSSGCRNVWDRSRDCVHHLPPTDSTVR